MTGQERFVVPATAQVRRALEGRVRGRTLCDLLARNAHWHGGRAALRQDGAGEWRSLTWAGYRAAVAEAALGLRAIGVRPGDNLLLVCPPRLETLVVDLAALHLGAVPVAVDTGVALPQLSWIARRYGARLAVTTGPGCRLAAAAGIPEIIALDAEGARGEASVTLAEIRSRGRVALERDPAAPERMTARVAPGDIATLCFGPAPDGGLRAVTVTHRAALWATASTAWWAKAVLGRAGARTLTYLPLSHSGGRLFGHYLVLWAAMETQCCPGADLLPEAVEASAPDVLVGTPLVWERLAGRPGLDRCRLPVSIGATLPPELGRRLRRSGIALLDMYGTTETFGPIAAHAPGAPREGTVGRPFPHLDVAIAPDGEIVVRTPSGVPGYFCDPDATEAIYGRDGTVRTGDLGHFGTGGQLVLTGRKRELIVTSGGRNVAPVPLERALGEHPLVAAACVLGEGRPFVTAIIAVAPEQVSGDGAADPGVAREIDAAVVRLNRRLARGERIRAYRTVTAGPNAGWGDLRPDGRVDRAAVERRYAPLVEELYAAREPPASRSVR